MGHQCKQMSGLGALCGLADLLPGDFWAHRRAARREDLLSWRSLVDAALARIDQHAQSPDASETHQRVPDEFWGHRRAARRERLLAVRSLLDAALGRLDAPPAAEKATHVEVM